MDLEHVRALEQLLAIILSGRLRKRKVIKIPSERAEEFEAAIKAALPPFDFSAHGFASNDTSGKVVEEETDEQLLDKAEQKYQSQIDS